MVSTLANLSPVRSVKASQVVSQVRDKDTGFCQAAILSKEMDNSLFSSFGLPRLNASSISESAVSVR